MDSSVLSQAISVLFLVLLSAFFSSAETSMTTVNKIRIQALAEEGSKNARILEKVISDSGKMLSAILIGNNLVNMAASALMTTLTIQVLGNAYVGLATGALTLLILIFGEITPKTLATIHSEKLALAYARPIYFLMVILTPIIYIIGKCSTGVLFLMKVDPNAKTNIMTEHELRTLVNVSQEDGVIEREEKQMIYNVFDFGDSQAKDIMVPRVDVVFLDVHSTYQEVIEIFHRERFTRFPVYENSTDNVIGVLNVKDLLVYAPSQDFSVRNFLREPYFTYEYKKTSELMMEMRKDSINFTIVLDEYGATAGLITLEDLLEEIVGEIRDEYDKDEEELIRSVGDREYIVEGSLKLDDLNNALELSLESEDYDSVGGYIIGCLDHLPKAGESITDENGIRMTVESVDKNRIDKVHLVLPETADAPSEESSFQEHSPEG